LSAFFYRLWAYIVKRDNLYGEIGSDPDFYIQAQYSPVPPVILSEAKNPGKTGFLFLAMAVLLLYQFAFKDRSFIS